MHLNVQSIIMIKIYQRKEENKNQSTTCQTTNYFVHDKTENLSLKNSENSISNAKSIESAILKSSE